MTSPDISPSEAKTLDADEAYLKSLGYEQTFERKISLWGNFALGFVYLSPMVGVVAMFGVGLAIAGPPAIFWIILVGIGQFLVALVFGEIVSQFPLAGGIYQWARRLWGGRYAWQMSWQYIWCIMIAIATTALFGSDFVVSLFKGTADEPSVTATPTEKLWITLAMLGICLLFNLTGTRTLALIAKIGLAGELIGIIVVGLYLLVFERKQEFSVFFDSLGAGGSDGYIKAFLGASLVGLLLFYGFEACGEVAEETPNPARSIPRAMQMTVGIGGAAALLAYGGFVLAAPNLPAIISGDDSNPIPTIMQDSIGTVGTKLFLVVALTSFLAGVMSQQAAASRLVFSFARDDMFPGSRIFKKVSETRHHLPVNALLAINVVPVLLTLFNYFSPDGLLRIAAFQVLAGYVAFQMVVLAALRARIRGWRPAGIWNLGRFGMVINIAALAYGILACIMLAKPSGDAALPFFDRWTALIGFIIVSALGLTYMLITKPELKSTAPEGDAKEVADRIRVARQHLTENATAR
ncbi:amino acid permease [Rhodococcus sp. SC4]|nr:amino acid permease [Rhodococcus sp. SC4]